MRRDSLQLLPVSEPCALFRSNDADTSKGTAKSGFTPLHGAAFQGRPEVVQLLLDHGVDPLHRHEDGFVAMHRACWGSTVGHTQAVLAFLEHGVDVRTTAKDPDFPSRFEEQGGMMTPLNMTGSEPPNCARPFCSSSSSAFCLLLAPFLTGFCVAVQQTR